jgi:hypothetical protein
MEKPVYLQTYSHAHTHTLFARMAEVVDALVSGTSVLTNVQVRVLFRAQKRVTQKLEHPLFYALRPGRPRHRNATTANAGAARQIP